MGGEPYRYVVEYQFNVKAALEALRREVFASGDYNGADLQGLRRGCLAGLADPEERDHAIGLFQGMFEKNILTFNPGWDSNAQKVAQFTDVRELQRQLKAKGVEFQQQADESTTGPASFIAVDPDGNPILVDQHV